MTRRETGPGQVASEVPLTLDILSLWAQVVVQCVVPAKTLLPEAPASQLPEPLARIAPFHARPLHPPSLGRKAASLPQTTEEQTVKGKECPEAIVSS